MYFSTRVPPVKVSAPCGRDAVLPTKFVGEISLGSQRALSICKSLMISHAQLCTLTIESHHGSHIVHRYSIVDRLDIQ